MSPHFSLFWGKTDVGFYVPNMKTILLPTKAMQKQASVMVWGCISAHGIGDLHICEGTINAEAYVGILERHVLSRPRQRQRNSTSISARQCQASFCTSYNSVAL